MTSANTTGLYCGYMEIEAPLLALGERHDLSEGCWIGSRVAATHFPAMALVDRLVPAASCHQHACAGLCVLCVSAMELYQLRTAVVRTTAAAISPRSRK